MDSAISPLYDPLQEIHTSARPSLLFRLRAEGRREVVFWILQTSFWAAIGTIGVLLILAFKSPLPDVGWVVFLRAASGFVLTCGLRLIYLQPWLRNRSGSVKCLLMAACCLAAGIVEGVLMQSAIAAGISFPGGAGAFAFRLMFVRSFVLFLWSLLYFAAHLLEDEHALELRATRAELAAREHELRHLQARMNPHFVFNSLNAVLTCKEDPTAVQEITKSLTDYLRFLLQDARPLEPLSRELEALEQFLVVQSTHLNKNLVCRIQCGSKPRAVMVPPMILQPLLENAFQHRPTAPDQSLQIWLSARVEDGFLRITLSNTGSAVPISAGQAPPNGISALRQRLRLLLGPEALVEEQMDNGWIRVTIHIPLPP